MREHFFKSNALLVEFVAAVIDDDVDARVFLSKCRTKCPARLIAKVDPRIRIFVNAARFVYVDAVNESSFSKIMPPHLEAASAVNANFKNVDFLSPEFAKVTLIDRKIVSIFPNPGTFVVRVKIVLELGFCDG